TFDTTVNPPVDWGDSILRFDLSLGATVQDYFTPSDQNNLDTQDADLGSGGVLVLPDQSGTYPHLLVEAGKEGNIYVVNRDIFAASDSSHPLKNMGHYSSSSDGIVQQLNSAVGGMWATPVYFNGKVYFGGSGDFLKAFTLTNGLLSTSPTDETSASYGFPGPTPTISANGTSNAILWMIDAAAYSNNGAGGPEILRAYNPSSLSSGELYDSNINSSRDAAGGAIKFQVPTVVNGKVYVGAEGQLNVYGLIGSVSQVATPSILPGSEGFSGTLGVTITDSTSGSAIYYTTDGSTPSPGVGTTKAYAGSFNVTATTTVNAIATESGFTNSAIASATYTLQSTVATPAIAPGTESFSGTLPVSISDSTSGSAIYYTTDGSTPSPGVGTTKLYSGSFTLTSSATVNAIATESGFTNSAVASATYTLQQQTVATPAIGPAPGTYTNSVAVTITDSTSGSAIYYTTDGTSPSPGVGTTKLYSASFSLTSSATVNAIATESGFSNSSIASSAYTIQSQSTGLINFSGGFTTTSGLQFNGNAVWNQTTTHLHLTDGAAHDQAGSVYFTTPVNVQSFTNDFSFQLTGTAPLADGFTFIIQNSSATALGSNGGGLGYGPDYPGGSPIGIPTSVAIKFDLYNNSGEGTDSTGLYTDGASPSAPAIDLTSSGINLHSGDVMNVHMTYDGATLTMTITDPTAAKTFTTSWTVNIPSVVGGSTALVGFTAGEGWYDANQDIISWSYSSGGT
ncbi:MAG: FN3 associated domain-containing protein, partial [Blastocatellia bacterium]